jgi:hypothetical protein
VQVERAFLAHYKGAFIKPPHFARDHTWRSLNDFYRHLDSLSVNHWKSLLEFKSDSGDTDVGSVMSP